jgi:hypothetical protein
LESCSTYNRENAALSLLANRGTDILEISAVLGRFICYGFVYVSYGPREDTGFVYA